MFHCTVLLSVLNVCLGTLEATSLVIEISHMYRQANNLYLFQCFIWMKSGNGCGLKLKWEEIAFHAWFLSVLQVQSNNPVLSIDRQHLWFCCNTIV